MQYLSQTESQRRRDRERVKNEGVKKQGERTLEMNLSSRRTKKKKRKEERRRRSRRKMERSTKLKKKESNSS